MNNVTIGTTIAALLLASGLAGCSPSPDPQRHHSGPGTATPPPPAATNPAYDIAALTPQQIDDLLHGRGADLALAAECNDSPGPLHVVELADQLGLSSDQRAITQELAERMRVEARDLGRRIVDIEQTLDDEFRSGTMNAERLASLTASSASLAGQLRNVHLRTHLQTRTALTEQQIDSYYERRRDSGKCAP